MSTLNSMMTHLMPYAYENKLTMQDLVIVVDITLCKVKVEPESIEALASYVDTMCNLNKLYEILSEEDLARWKQHTDASVFDNDRVSKLTAYPDAILRFQDKRLNIWNEVYPHLIEAITQSEHQVLENQAEDEVGDKIEEEDDIDELPM